MNSHFRFALCLMLCALFSAEIKAGQQLWQTNSAGDDIHVFDVNSRSLLTRIVVGAEPHGIAAPDDGHVIYVSLEANGQDRGELVWIDPKTYAVVHRLAVGPEPHAIATTPDGRWVYVPCRDGNYWVVDAQAKKVVKKIHTGGRPHNTQASSDGKYMFLSPMGEPMRVTIVDVAANHTVTGFIPFSDSVRPPALSRDGSRLFQHVDGLNGFEVGDVGERKVVARVEHSSDIGWFSPIRKIGFLTFSGLQRCHGLAIRPDQQEIWSICADNLAIHNINDPAYPETQLLKLSARGYWLTFSNDSRFAYVALSTKSSIAVVDTDLKQIIDHLEVGKAPKRNIVIGTGER